MNYLKSKFKIIVIGLILLSPGYLFAQDMETKPVSLEEALNRASEENKKILIDVYASWCPYCQRMHSEVYTNEEVLRALSDHYLWVKINVESEDIVRYKGSDFTEAQFARALENENVPTTFFMNDEGAIIGKQPGYLEPDIFSNLLNYIGSDAFLSQSFDEFRNSR
mgnify:CR=1 FL=1|tara:strand:+ start:43002 stop:43499 length:498 start_codon:yes stop_codon:yes gene_type:complete